jgi:hypothetical protein
VADGTLSGGSDLMAVLLSRGRWAASTSTLPWSGSQPRRTDASISKGPEWDSTPSRCDLGQCRSLFACAVALAKGSASHGDLRDFGNAIAQPSVHYL